MLVDNMLNVSIHFAVPAFMLWWWVGSALAACPELVTTHRWTPRPWLKNSVAGVGVLLLLVSAARAFAFWRAEINFFDGFKRSKAGIDMMGARKFLEASYRWHPLEVNNSYELGNVYARLGMRDEATSMYGKALDANPGYDEIFFNRATILMQAGHDEEAIRHYRICLAINPLSREAYNVLAGLYLKDASKNADLVVSLYKQGLSVFPQDRDLWNNLGWVLTQERRWLEAREAYQRALSNDPNFELGKRNLAVVNATLRKAGER